jgi:hypothetical protein
VGSLTTRAAFSHVPFLHSLQWMVQSMFLEPNQPEAPAVPPSRKARPFAHAHFLPLPCSPCARLPK